jgi:outer membrane lipoprotein-sorting protein
MHERKGQRLRTPPAPAMLLLIACLLSPFPAAAESAAWSIDHLMQSLASVEQRQARFRETRELSLLQQALTSEGTLTFQRPDTLIKQYDPPNGMRYRIDANRLLMRKADGEETVIRLDNAPQLQAYVAALRAVLAGNLQQLQTYFELHLEGDRKAWQLTLTPRQPGLARQVIRIEIFGSEQGIEQFVVMEQGGDRTITRLHEPHAG